MQTKWSNPVYQASAEKRVVMICLVILFGILWFAYDMGLLYLSLIALYSFAVRDQLDYLEKKYQQAPTSSETGLPPTD